MTMPVVSVFDQPYALVTLEEAKVALGEDGDARNALIDGLILAAQGELDGPKGWVGISVAVQGIEYVADDFTCPIVLPAGPVTGQVEVFYLDADGVEQLLDVSVYQVALDGKLTLTSGESWPTIQDTPGAVRVQYYAGIIDQFDPRIAMMKTAIILHVRMTLDGVEREASRRAIESIVRPLWVPTC
jgi:hypothetical protein